MRWFEGWLAENAPGAKIVLRMEYKGLLIYHAVRAFTEHMADALSAHHAALAGEGSESRHRE